MNIKRIRFLREILAADPQGRDTISLEFSYDSGMTVLHDEDVAAIVDLDDAALDRAIHELDVDEALCYKDLDEALQDTAPEAALISVPCPQRDPVFEAACRDGA